MGVGKILFVSSWTMALFECFKVEKSLNFQRYIFWPGIALFRHFWPRYAFQCSGGRRFQRVLECFCGVKGMLQVASWSINALFRAKKSLKAQIFRPFSFMRPVCLTDCRALASAGSPPLWSCIDYSLKCQGERRLPCIEANVECIYSANHLRTWLVRRPPGTAVGWPPGLRKSAKFITAKEKIGLPTKPVDNYGDKL